MGISSWYVVVSTHTMISVLQYIMPLCNWYCYECLLSDMAVKSLLWETSNINLI